MLSLLYCWCSSGATLTLAYGRRYGLIGRNGVGMFTMFVNPIRLSYSPHLREKYPSTTHCNAGGSHPHQHIDLIR